MRFKYMVFGLLLSVVSVTYGFAIRHLEIPPYQTMQSLYRMYKLLTPDQMADFTLDTTEISRDLADLANTAEAVRDGLKERVIIPKELVTVSARDIDTHQSEIRAKVYGLKTKAILTRAIDGASCLRVYIQGHGGNPFGFDFHNALLKSSNDLGCDFLSMSMIGLGLNRGRVEFPSGKYANQTTRLIWGGRHGNYFQYQDNNMPQKDPLALFLTPHYYTIQSVMQNYDEVSVMGLSGGGWYAVWLAALLPEIDYSIVYAGSLPMVYRTTARFFADYEEIAGSVYPDVDYWQLYFLAGQSANVPAGRKLYFVFNDKDPCCFMDPEASHFKSVAEEIYADNVKIIIDQNSKHEIRVPVVEAIWDEVRNAKILVD